MITIEEIFAQNLKQLRGNLTQAQVAEKANIPLRSLQRLEQGQLPHRDNLVALARAFNVPESRLFFDESLAAKPGLAESLETISNALQVKLPKLPEETETLNSILSLLSTLNEDQRRSLCAQLRRVAETYQRTVLGLDEVSESRPQTLRNTQKSGT